MILHTIVTKYEIARYEADEDTSTILDLTTSGNFANIPTASGTTYLGAFDIHGGLTQSMKVNGIAFAFTGGDATDKTFTWKLFAWRNLNGAATQVAEGTGTLGTQAVVTYPHNSATATNKFWADTLTVTWYNWYKKVDSTDETGHNTKAEIWLDACGYRWWYVEIADADGATEAGDIAAYYGFF